jgi:hypothetical protein
MNFTGEPVDFRIISFIKPVAMKTARQNYCPIVFRVDLRIE